MMINKHRFNIFDLSVIALALLLVTFHLGAYASLPEENGNVYYTLTVNEIEAYALSSFKTECAVCNENGNIIGTVKDVEISQKEDLLIDDRDNSAADEYYGLYTVKIKVSSKAVLTKSSIIANGQIISSGRNIRFTTNGVIASGVCSEVAFSYYDGGQQ